MKRTGFDASITPYSCLKALLKPFNIGLSEKATDDDNNVTQDDNSDPVLFEDEDDEGGEEDEEEQPDKEDTEDDDVDELEELSEDEQNWVLEETAVIRATVTKVSNLKRSRSHF
jgi:hypothetical protein